MYSIVVENDNKNKYDCIRICNETIHILEREDSDILLDKLFRYAIFISAKEEDAYVGFCSVYANNEITRNAYISFICVVNGSQNKGYGRLLIERAIAEARNEGMRLIRLEVRNENRKAIGFYEHCGFNFEKKSTRTIGSSYYALRIS